MAARLRETKVLLMQRRHWPIQAQGRWLGAVVRGHLAYYSVPGNIHQVTASATSSCGTGAGRFGAAASDTA
jgi:RNA-directed DNA polymerase